MDATIIVALVGFGGVLIGKAVDLLLDRLKHRDEQESKELTAIKEIGSKFDRLDQKVDNLQYRLDESNTVQCRVRILRFAEEIRLGTPLHTKDHFDQTMEDIRQYDKFCEAHHEFRNEITAASEALIRESYQERLRRDDFL